MIRRRQSVSVKASNASMSRDRLAALGALSEPSEPQIEAAAKAWMAWQFPGRAWDDAVPAMKAKFMDGARRALRAAAFVKIRGS
jgi:hypothetical protein